MTNTPGSQVRSSEDHFWIAASPFFNSTLLVAPQLSRRINRESRTTTTLEVYDCFGAKVNRVEVAFPATQVGIIELDPFITGLKQESGFQHGHLVVSSSPSAHHVCRIASGDFSKHSSPNSSTRAEVGVTHSLSRLHYKESGFVPLSLSNDREQMITLVNCEKDEGQVVVRLFYGNRSPEWTITIPAFGSRVVSIQHELLTSTDDRSWQKVALQGYLRITGKNAGSVGYVAWDKVFNTFASRVERRDDPIAGAEQPHSNLHTNHNGEDELKLAEVLSEGIKVPPQYEGAFKVISISNNLRSYV